MKKKIIIIIIIIIIILIILILNKKMNNDSNFFIYDNTEIINEISDETSLWIYSIDPYYNPNPFENENINYNNEIF